MLENTRSIFLVSESQSFLLHLGVSTRGRYCRGAMDIYLKKYIIKKHIRLRQCLKRNQNFWQGKKILTLPLFLWSLKLSLDNIASYFVL